MTSQTPSTEAPPGVTRPVDGHNGHDDEPSREPAAAPGLVVIADESSSLPRRASRRGRAAARRRRRTTVAPAAVVAAAPAEVAVVVVPEAEVPQAVEVPEVKAEDVQVVIAPEEGRSGVVGEFVGLVAAGGIGAGAAASGVVEAPAPAPAPEAPPPVGPGDPFAPPSPPTGPGPKQRRLRRHRRIVVTAMVLLVGIGAGLVVVGLGRVRSSTAGTYVDATLQPDEPGYVALVTPTPTMLVLQRDASDELVGVSLLALRSQDEGGSVVLIPAATQAPFAEDGTDLAEVFATGGAETVATQLELMLNISIGDTVELDDAGWASLVDPLGSISMVLEQPVGDWPAGQVDLAAADVGEFLGARDEGESELARLDRQELFWDEWLPRVTAEGPSAVPGESDVGLGRFVRALATGTPNVVGLPVAEPESASDELFEPSDTMVTALIAREVPYPQEPSAGSRVRIRLLNGTAVPELAVLAAAPLVEAGAEVALSGNASSFTEPRTLFIYGKSRLREEANNLRDALGVGEVERSTTEESVEPADEADRIDVTVVLGADAPEVIRRLESTG